MSSGPELPSGTVTFLFTDIEGSTRLLKQLGEGYGEVLGEHTRILRAAFAAHGGRVVDTQGDSFFVAFRRAREAVAAALEAQRQLATHDWPDGMPVKVRMGLHTGEPAVGEERYLGLGVHRAARVGAAGHGGQVLLSQSTRELLRDDPLPGVSCRDLGLHRLKDLDERERIYQLQAPGLPTAFPPLKTEPRRRRVDRRLIPVAVVLAGGAVAAAVLLTRGQSGSAQASAGVAADSVGVFDAQSGKLIAQALVRTGPSSVAYGEDSVWVTNTNDNSVTRIDPKTNASVQTIPVGQGPAGIAIGGGFVWVANGLDGKASKIDPNTNTAVETIQVGNGPTGVAFGGGRVWVANSTDRTVTEIAPGSQAPPRTIPVGPGADALAFGFGFVWVVSETGNSVTRIGARSGTVLPPITVGNGPSGIAVGAGAVWVANRLDGTVSRIDPRTGGVKVIPVGEGPSAVASGSRVVWVSNERAGMLSRIDPDVNKVVQIVKIGNRPAGVALAGDTLYVAVGTSGLEHRGGRLTVLAERFDSIDPAATYNWSAVILTNDGLLTFERVGGNSGAHLVPDLATSIPTPTDGGRTYTFQVRAGIHYSTGALVQPADFRRAIERSLANPAGTGFYLTGIVGAATCAKTPKRCDLSPGIVVDSASNTVSFHLTAPDPDFLDKLALSSAYAVPAGTPLKAPLPLPATGPYMIEGYNGKHGLRLVRNPRFHEWAPAAQPAGYPDEIIWKFGVSPDAQVNAVRQNEADHTQVSADVVPALRRDGYGNRLHVSPGVATRYYFLNTRLAPFNNVKARRALNYAVDRDRVELEHGTDIGQSSCQVLPPNFAGYVRYCPYPLDLTRARQLVAASGTIGQG